MVKRWSNAGQTLVKRWFRTGQKNRPGGDAARGVRALPRWGRNCGSMLYNCRNRGSVLIYCGSPPVSSVGALDARPRWKAPTGRNCGSVLYDCRNCGSLFFYCRRCSSVLYKCRNCGSVLYGAGLLLVKQPSNMLRLHQREHPSAFSMPAGAGGIARQLRFSVI